MTGVMSAADGTIQLSPSPSPWQLGMLNNSASASTSTSTSSASGFPSPCPSPSPSPSPSHLHSYSHATPSSTPTLTTASTPPLHPASSTSNKSTSTSISATATSTSASHLLRYHHYPTELHSKHDLKTCIQIRGNLIQRRLTELASLSSSASSSASSLAVDQHYSHKSKSCSSSVRNTIANFQRKQESSGDETVKENQYNERQTKSQNIHVKRLTQQFAALSHDNSNSFNSSTRSKSRDYETKEIAASASATNFGSTDRYSSSDSVSPSLSPSPTSRTFLISCIARRRGQVTSSNTDETDLESTHSNLFSSDKQSLNRPISSKRSLSVAIRKPKQHSVITHDKKQATSNSVRKAVRFNRSVSLREFARLAGGSLGVPRTGAVPLGLDWKVVSQTNKLVHPISTPRKPVTDTSPATPFSSSTSASIVNNTLTQSPQRRYPATKPEDELPRLQEDQRRDTIAAITPISEVDNEQERDELDFIRMSRLTNFCSCQPQIMRRSIRKNKSNDEDDEHEDIKPDPLGSIVLDGDEGDVEFELVYIPCCTDPNICQCLIAGIQCHTEGSHYCQCSKHVLCANPEGSYLFDEYAVRQHAINLLRQNFDTSTPITSASLHSKPSPGSESGYCSPKSVPFSPSFSPVMSPTARNRPKNTHNAIDYQNSPSIADSVFGRSSSFSVTTHAPLFSRRASKTSPPASPILRALHRKNSQDTGSIKS